MIKEVFLHNSLTGEKEKFEPIKEGKVSMYVCGPTVYGDPHIGNMRPVVTFDVWRRLFKFLGYEVTFVSNYTDVDDKIINRAKELGISEAELTDKEIDEFRRLVDEVGAMQPDITPRPTLYMDQMISYIGDLVKKGAAYQVGGDVYFKVSSISDYGELSGNTVESLVAGARIEVNSLKDSPLDFTLWKQTDEGIKWKTPFSEGRPGWHTECCVMISSIFKDQGGYIDIHGGGFDLKFPHHENEIAQAKAHNGNKLARYWLHNGFLSMDGEKMSKSLGNVILAKDVIDKFGGMPFRLFLLGSHYRSPASFTEEAIKEAIANFEKISTAYRQAAVKLQLCGIDLDSLTADGEEEFLFEMCDDLNTPNALSILYGDLKVLNGLLRSNPLDSVKLSHLFARVRDYLFVFGLKVGYPYLTEDDKILYQQYLDAKAAKDFATSDTIRAKLQQKGIL